MKMKLDEDVEMDIETIKEYLKKEGVEATESEIVGAAIRVTRRLGAGDWTFVCELMDGEEREKWLKKKK